MATVQQRPPNTKLCACGCGEEIPAYDKRGRPRWFQSHHRFRNKSESSDYGRVCSECGADKTGGGASYKLKSGVVIRYRQWRRNVKGDGWLCKTCFQKSEAYKSKHYPRQFQIRRFLFKDKRLHHKEPPRIGVCNFCRAVAGQINAQTGKLCERTGRILDLI